MTTYTCLACAEPVAPANCRDRWPGPHRLPRARADERRRASRLRGSGAQHRREGAGRAREESEVTTTNDPEEQESLRRGAVLVHDLYRVVSIMR